jgi:hypothetical protein
MVGFHRYLHPSLIPSGGWAFHLSVIAVLTAGRFWKQLYSLHSHSTEVSTLGVTGILSRNSILPILFEISIG